MSQIPFYANLVLHILHAHSPDSVKVGSTELHEKLKERTGDNTLPIYAVKQVIEFLEYRKAVRVFKAYNPYGFGAVRLTVPGRMSIVSNAQLFIEEKKQSSQNIIEADNVIITQISNSQDVSVNANQKLIQTKTVQSWQDVGFEIETSNLIVEAVKDEAIKQIKILEEESGKNPQNKDKIRNALQYLRSKLPGELWILVANVAANHVYEVLKPFLTGSP